MWCVWSSLAFFKCISVTLIIVYPVSFLHNIHGRLLLLCLFENDGIHRMVIEFARDCQSEGSANESVRQIIFRVAQLITSIPDKARAGAPTSLSSPYPFIFSFIGIEFFILLCVHFSNRRSQSIYFQLIPFVNLSY